MARSPSPRPDPPSRARASAAGAPTRLVAAPRPGAPRRAVTARPAARRRGNDRLLLGGIAVVLLATLVLVGALVVAGFNDDGGSNGTQNPPPVGDAAVIPPLPQTTATAPPAAPPAPTQPPAPTATSQPAAPADAAPVVCLDVGHGGIDLGKVREDPATGALIQEKDLLLDQALDLETRLQARGFGVVLTRRTDTEINSSLADVNGDGETGTAEAPDNLDELQARVNICNEAGADLLISMHINGAENLALNGYEAWWVKDRPFSDDSQRFAELVTGKLGEGFAAAGHETTFRGAADDTLYDPVDGDEGTFDHYVVLSPDVPARNFVGSTMPGAVVEALFLSNDDDFPFVVSPQGHETIVAAYEAAIVDFFGAVGGSTMLTSVTVTPAPESTATPTTAAPTATAETSAAPLPTRLPPPPDDGSGQSVVYERGPSDRKEVAYTFDAGADRGVAEAILDLLDERGIKGSFGMTGLWAEENADLVKRMADDGHMIFNHTWDHSSITGVNRDNDPSTAKPDPLTKDQLKQQLDDTEQLVKDITGGYAMAPYFRPPYGDYDATSLGYLAELGYPVTVYWTCDTHGWDGWTAAEIVQYCTSNIQNSEIMLLHVGANSADLEALPVLIDFFAEEGYAAVTIEEILQP